SAAAAYRLGQIAAVLVEVRNRDVAQRAYVGQRLLEELDPALALGAPPVVLGRRELVLDSSVADEYHRAGKGERNRFRLERAAVDEQSVIVFGQCRDELIHDPAHRADVDLLGSLADQRQIGAR